MPSRTIHGLNCATDQIQVANAGPVCASAGPAAALGASLVRFHPPASCFRCVLRPFRFWWSRFGRLRYSCEGLWFACRLR